MYVTLTEAKKHLNIDESFQDDDNYIGVLIQVAEEAIAHHIDIALEDMVVDGVLPSAIHHSILLLVGNLYANREPVAYTSVAKVPYTLILGDNEKENGLISYRLHGEKETTTLPKEDFLKMIKEEIDTKALRK